MVVDELADCIVLHRYFDHVFELGIGRQQNIGLIVDDILLLVGTKSKMFGDLSGHYICLQNNSIIQSQYL